VPADVLENKCRQVNEDVDKQALNWLARGKLPAFLHTKFGLERLPEHRYWLAADVGATREAKLALTTGETLPSKQDPRVRGVVKVRILDFRLCAGGYLAERGLAELPFMASWPAWPFEHRRTGRGTVDGKADPDRKRHRDAGETPRRN
jgi:hypothetical protein